MAAGYVRALALIAVAALIAGAQCYGSCAIATFNSSQAPANGCHHHQPRQHSDRTCTHQHTALTGPEASLANSAVADAAPIAPTASSPLPAPVRPWLPAPRDNGSPPDGRNATALLALRI